MEEEFDLIEVNAKAEDEYVGSSVMPDGELAILLNLLVLEVSKNEHECVVPVGLVGFSLPVSRGQTPEWSC